MRLQGFHYFRGIAIVYIVMAHAIDYWHTNSFIERLIANLLLGGSVMFVFISGFFFHYVYYQDFHFLTFLLKKARKIALPYLLMSLLALLYYYMFSFTLPHFEALGLNRSSSVLEIVFTYLRTGKVFMNYWYVPFICLVFLSAPLILRFIKLSFAAQMLLLVLLIPISMYVGRPTYGLSTLHSAVFFYPVFLLGTMCSVYRDTIFHYLQDKTLLLGILVLLLAMLQTMIEPGYVGHMLKYNIFDYAGFDLCLVQKIVMCFFFLALFLHNEHKIILLDLLANTSFAIYFLHVWVLELFDKTELFRFFEPLTGLVAFCAITVLAVIISLMISYAIKLLLRDKSQYLIGW